MILLLLLLILPVTGTGTTINSVNITLSTLNNIAIHRAIYLLLIITVNSNTASTQTINTPTKTIIYMTTHY